MAKKRNPKIGIDNSKTPKEAMDAYREIRDAKIMKEKLRTGEITQGELDEVIREEEE